MEPIASAISRLEGEQNIYYGELLPTLLTIKRKLQGIADDSAFTSFHPLLKGLIKSLSDRFKDIFNVEKVGELAVLAAFSYPKFKYIWLSCFTEEKQTKIRDIIMRKADEMTENENQNHCEAAMERQLSDFYDFAAPSVVDEPSPASTNVDVEIEIMKYIKDSRKDVEMLNSYPIIKKLFLKYNTPLPSSAPVERLFSYATLMCWSKFNRLTPKFF